MVRKELIDKARLDEHIEALTAGYLESYVNILKIPSLIARCEEGKGQSEEQDSVLDTQIESHKRNIVNNEEQMKSLSEIYDRLLEFKNSL